MLFPINNKNYRLSSIIIILIINIIIFALFQSRAFAISCLASIIILLNPKDLKLYIVILITTLTASFCYKTNSTLGRIFIYKNTFKIIAENFPNGLGLNNFQKEYLYYQMKYFESSTTMNSREMMLADDTRHAFNDYLLIISELGIFGFIFIILIGTMVVEVFISKEIVETTAIFLTKFLIIQILICSFFTYFFSLDFVCIVFIFCLLILLKSIVNDLFLKNNCLSLIIISAVLFFQNKIKEISDESVSKEGIQLANSGLLIQSNAIFFELNENNRCNKACKFVYAKNLLTLGKNDSSLMIIKSLLSKNTSYQYYSLLGDYFLQVNDVKSAIINYKIAINMVPNRFEDRFKLLNIYEKGKNNEQLKITGNQIISLNPKVPSERISFIKNYTYNLLLTL